MRAAANRCLVSRTGCADAGACGATKMQMKRQRPGTDVPGLLSPRLGLTREYYQSNCTLMRAKRAWSTDVGVGHVAFAVNAPAVENDPSSEL